MSELTVVTWKWQPKGRYRSNFTHEHVNTMLRMVQRNFSKPFQFVCVTDDWRKFDSAIRVVPLWNDLADVPSPHGEGNPSCYRRLKAFSREAVEILGPRIVSVDLDAVVTGSLDPLWDREEDFVGWNRPIKLRRYSTTHVTWLNGSMWMLRTGTRTKVWTEFDPVKSPKLTQERRLFGSDQAWMSYMLPNEASWSSSDGVLSYRENLKTSGFKLPESARIVFFNGGVDPWSEVALKQCPWIPEYYR